MILLWAFVGLNCNDWKCWRLQIQNNPLCFAIHPWYLSNYQQHDGYVLNCTVGQLEKKSSLHPRSTSLNPRTDYWEAKSSLFTQEIPHVLCKPKIHYRVYNSPVWARSGTSNLTAFSQPKAPRSSTVAEASLPHIQSAVGLCKQITLRTVWKSASYRCPFMNSSL
jgi:hypothetical protein